MQFEGVQNDGSQSQPLTLHQELHILRDMDWISVCMQRSEAVRYLNFDVEMLHNVKCNKLSSTLAQYYHTTDTSKGLSTYLPVCVYIY